MSDAARKVAVVTGAGGDIGRAVACRLAARGDRVYVNDIDAARAERSVEQIRREGGDAVAVPGDMGVEADVVALFARVEREERRLDVLVTQAGVVADPTYFHKPDGLDEQTWQSLLAEDGTLAFGRYMRAADFDFILHHDLHSTLLCCHHAARLMRQGGGGFIVTMSAAGGGISSHFSPPYAVAKGGVVGLTRALARTLLADNIVVNCIVQGFIDAGVWREVPDRYPEIWQRDWDLRIENGTRTVHARPGNTLPLRRLGRPEEVAALVAFLVSGEASYLVGQSINLSGGVLIP
jgi:3-oxoacyl-[acyl-carrier protein] reductase